MGPWCVSILCFLLFLVSFLVLTAVLLPGVFGAVLGTGVPDVIPELVGGDLLWVRLFVHVCGAPPLTIAFGLDSTGYLGITCNEIWYTTCGDIILLYNGIAPMFSTTHLKYKGPNEVYPPKHDY